MYKFIESDTWKSMVCYARDAASARSRVALAKAIGPEILRYYWPKCLKLDAMEFLPNRAQSIKLLPEFQIFRNVEMFRRLEWYREDFGPDAWDWTAVEQVKWGMKLRAEGEHQRRAAKEAQEVFQTLDPAQKRMWLVTCDDQ